MAKGRKTGGRTKGTPNKLTHSVQEFLEAVLSNEDAVGYAKEFLELRGKSVGQAVHVFMRLLEYRFGQPKGTMEHTGPDGGPITHTIRFGDGKRNK